MVPLFAFFYLSKFTSHYLKKKSNIIAKVVIRRNSIITFLGTRSRKRRQVINLLAVDKKRKCRRKQT